MSSLDRTWVRGTRVTHPETVCPQCGYVNRAGVAFCENPSLPLTGSRCGAYLRWEEPHEPVAGQGQPAPSVSTAPSGGAAPGPPVVAPVASGHAAVQIAFNVREQTVEPGGESTCAIRVRNLGTIVDRYVLELTGAAAGWSTVDPVEIPLYPGTEATATLRLRPPRAPWVAAGFASVRVRATSKSEPSVCSDTECVVEVRPFLTVEATLVPRTSGGTDTAVHRLVVENSGNRPVQLVAHASDPDDLLVITVEPSVLQVDAGQSTVAAVRVTARRAAPPGVPQPRPFSVQLEGPPGGKWTAAAVFLQEPAPAPPPPVQSPPSAPSPVPAPPALPTKRPLSPGGCLVLVVLWLLLLLALAFGAFIVVAVVEDSSQLTSTVLELFGGTVVLVIVLISLMRLMRRRRRRPR
jgi:hypothetical protein